jgi:hypothetical protein
MGFVRGHDEEARFCQQIGQSSYVLHPDSYIFPSHKWAASWKHCSFPHIRQGDPFSPYFFILCAEAMSSMLQCSSREGAIMGIPFSRGGTRIHTSYLWTIVSFSTVLINLRELEYIHIFLGKYEEASGNS